MAIFLIHARLVLAVLVIALSLSCARRPPEFQPDRYVSTAQGKFWIPEPKDNMINPLPSQVSSGMPADIEPDADKLALPHLVDVALRNNPDTRVAWENARASAAAWAGARGEYYPTIDGSGSGGGQKAPPVRWDAFGQAGATLSYLLFDFGGRGARAEAARQALIAANWTHNQVIQDTLRDVPQAYYIHISNKAQVEAAEENLTDARTTLDATRLRKQAGVATIADVLQAEAHEAQVRVDLIGAQGEVETSRGTLAKSVGWPANIRFTVAGDPEHLPIRKIERDVDILIDEARRNRPDLNSAVATLRQKEAELKKATAARLPVLSASGEAQYQRYIANNQTYYAGALLQIPIFHGFALKNAERKARAELEAARSALRSQEDTVINDVWSSYYNFRTAVLQVGANEDLLKSASESFKVSLGRYKAGAAEITEVLDAQSTLADARAQLVDARMNMYTSYTELMHAIGSAIPVAYAAEGEWPDAGGGD